jgi:hypothetical protein
MKLTNEQKIFYQLVKIAVQENNEKLKSEFRKIVREELEYLGSSRSSTKRLPKRQVVDMQDEYEDDYEEDDDYETVQFEGKRKSRPTERKSSTGESSFQQKAQKFKKLNESLLQSDANMYATESGSQFDLSTIRPNEKVLDVVDIIDRDYSDLI